MAFLLNESSAISKVLQGGIGICITNTNQHTANLKSYWKILSTKEQEHAQQFYFNSLSKRYIIAHGILRKLLATFTGIQAAEIQFHYNKYQKPYIDDSKIYFNLSYSADFIACAFAKDYQIGIDIEAKNTSIELDNIIHFALSPQELAHYLTLKLEEKIEYFYSVWTKKEALVKAIGLGLNYDFREINFTEDNYLGIYFLLNKNYSTLVNHYTKVWYISNLPFNQHYYGAIAAEIPNRNIFYLSLVY